MFNKFVSKGGFKDLKFSRRDFKFELRWLLWLCRVGVKTKSYSLKFAVGGGSGEVSKWPFPQFTRGKRRGLGWDIEMSAE